MSPETDPAGNGPAPTDSSTRHSPWFAGDATALAQAIVRGDCSAVQALERTLADVQALDPALNAVCLLRPEVARPRATALDAALSACADEASRAALLKRQPFFGVPLLVKDVGPATAHPDFPSRMGSTLFGPQGLAWPVTGTLAARYEAAGFVVFGRSTSPEMGISPSTEARAYGGPTRNPWHLAHSAGGSSGGAAAATASGMVTMAHANDGAGSIRIPASACGLIGLKPSRGLVPCGPLAGEGWGGLAVDHVLTRTVRDCAAALDISAGADAGAPYAVPWPDAEPGHPPHRGAGPQGFREALALPPPPGLRIGLVNQFYEGDPVHPEVAAAVQAFAAQLQALGHHVEPVRLPFGTLEVLRPVMQVVATGTALVMQAQATQRGRPIQPDDVEPSTFGAYELGRSLGATDYLAAVSALHVLGRRMGEFHRHHDLLLTPTLAEPPAQLGRWAMHNPDFLDYRLGPKGLWRYSPFCPLANATGAPAVSLPAGRSAQGLPIGAMLSAPLGGDALLLRVAAQWEAAAGLAPAPWRA